MARYAQFGAVVTAVLLPGVAYAQQDIRSLIVEDILPILDAVVPIIAGLALLYFFWGLALFILRADSEDDRKKGKTIMVWGTIALFVMFSIFGIIQILTNTFFSSFQSVSGPRQFDGIHPFGGVQDGTSGRQFDGIDPFGGVQDGSSGRQFDGVDPFGGLQSGFPNDADSSEGFDP